MVKLFRIASLCALLIALPVTSFAAKTHKVKKNESIVSIAKKYHVKVDELKAANNLSNSHLKLGTVLVVPPRSIAARHAGNEPSAQASGSTYKVKKGESLAKVAKKHGLALAELKRLNGINGNKVKPGTVLVVKGTDPAGETAERVVRRTVIKNRDLFSEKEYEQSLSELAVSEFGQPVDLNKSIQLKADNVSELRKTAYSFIGTRYRFGGTSRSGLDCSAFVQKVFRELEVNLPRTAREQFEVGNEVSPGDLKKGDLVFFHTYARFPSHVGIYLGNNKMIHASSRDRRVVISTMDTPYYRARYIGAKRIAKINPDIFKLDDLLLGVEEEKIDDVMKNDTLGLTAEN